VTGDFSTPCNRNRFHKAIVVTEVFCLFFLSVIRNIDAQPKAFIEAHYSKRDGLPSNVVYDVAQDNLGFIWFGTDHGLSRFDGNEFINYAIAEGAPDSEILKFYTDSKGQIWCYTLNGKVSTIYNGKILSDTSLAGLPLPNLGEQINGIVEIEGDILICSPNKIGILQPSGIKFLKSYTRNPHFIVYNDSLFISLQNEILSFDPKEEILMKVSDFGIGRKTNSYFERFGDYFITYYYDTYQSNIHLINVKTRTKERDSIRDVRVYNISSNNGIELYTDKGIYNYDPATRKRTLETPKIPATNRFVDRFQNIWISSFGEGVFLFKSSEFINVIDTTKKMVTRIESKEDHFYAISNNKHMLCTYDNVNVHCEENLNQKAKYNDVVELSNGSPLLGIGNIPDDDIISENYVSAVTLAIFDSILVASQNEKIVFYIDDEDGLKFVGDILNPNFGRIHKVIDLKDSTLIYQNPQGIFSTTLSIPSKIKPVFTEYLPGDALLTDSRNLWVGTRGAGLFRINQRDTLQITTNQGLSSDYINKVLLNEDMLWVSTTEGINILKFDNDDLLKVSDAPGVPGEVNDMSIYQNSIIVATNEGLFSFPIDADFVDENKPKFHLESFQSGGISFPINTINQTFELALRDFTVNFSTIFFSPGQPIYYRYRLISEGDSPDNSQWFSTPQSQLNFTNLQSDDYKLEIQYHAKNTPWQTGALFSISILPYWWQTIWFKILIILLLSLPLSYVGFRVRMFFKSRNRLKTEKLYAELMARNAQMNPHFMFNALNSVRNFVLTNNMEQSDRYLMIYARLMRKVLDLSDRLLIPISEELELTRLYLDLEQMRMGGEFDYDIKVNDEEALSYRCPSMILQPFAENAVIHGVRNSDQKGFIKILVSEVGDKIVFTVEDNGPGLQAKGENDHESKGTKIINEKLRLFRETYNFDIGMEKESDPDYGSYINISIPIIKG